MGEETTLESGGAGQNSGVVDIYPLSRYVFDSKEAVPEKDDNLTDRVQRLQSNYSRHGLRTCVGGVLLVELFQEPHALLLQVRNSFFKLPGGRLRPGEPDIQGLKRKLSSKLSLNLSGEDDDWQIGECLGTWWRSDLEGLPHPHPPPDNPKECMKIFLVRLPRNRRFVVPRNLKLLAVPLSRIQESSEVYGPVISLIPALLSDFSFNRVRV
ncbi:unnamed protein product [Spirodela intermedia]|uniref:Pre-mRNA cleavage factor Im 25 kDa subunit n=1 Tax=Spirodela intermedia TaxID=51605 RepID=A0A7I8KHQ2_SPIIN|nr:unnamed protein product [Spirodela intermedia]